MSNHTAQDKVLHVPNGISEALCGLVEPVAESLCRLAHGACDTSKETALALCLFTSGQDVVNAAQETAEETTVVRHCVLFRSFVGVDGL